jgi:hypothetical protein
MGVVSTGCDEVGIGVASRFSISWTSSKMKCSSDVSEFDTYFTWSSIVVGASSLIYCVALCI